MTTTPPDDDPLFAQWVRDTTDEPTREIRVRHPVAAALAVVVATIGWGVTLGVALDLLLHVQPLTTALTVILIGTACTLSVLLVLVARAK